jgi:hypothetical protein
MNSVLHQLVFDLLEQTSPEQWRAIAQKTGLKFSWIRAIAENRIPHPSASRLETLYEGLTGKAIELKR